MEYIGTPGRLVLWLLHWSPKLGTLSRRPASRLSLLSLHSSCLCCILGRYENRVLPSQVCSSGTFMESLPVLPSPAWGSAPSVSLSGLSVLPLRIFVVILGNTPRTPLSFKYQETRIVQDLKGSDGAWLRMGDGHDSGFPLRCRAQAEQLPYCRCPGLKAQVPGCVQEAAMGLCALEAQQQLLAPPEARTTSPAPLHPP